MSLLNHYILQSIGEWSNPSDEERARQQRVDRRLRRRAQETEVPRRLPKFPCPPENTIARPMQRNDDIISNPSEEDGLGVGAYYPELPLNMVSTPPRPLPPLPHSRGASGQFSTHDPAHAHSRGTSNHFETQPPVNGRRNSLNPFAKPFVFGVPRDSGSSAPEPLGTAKELNFSGHSRVASLGKPLNAAAQEFKPGGFTFRPPPGVPQLTFPVPETARPLPIPPVAVSSPVRAYQGREKRQRRGSSSSFDGEDTMNSFRFPGPPDGGRRSEPPSPRTDGSHQQDIQNASAPPFTFGHFPVLPFGPADSSRLPYSLIANAGSPDETQNDNTANAENGETILRKEDLTIPSAVKTKRAPVPLDFKHATSSNTIPAGVFKALVNAGDEKTRRTVLSRLDSREISEHLSSLDDHNVPPISRKISRSLHVSGPSEHGPQEQDDVFSSHVKRRSSLPSALLSAADSSQSIISIPAVDLTGKFELQRHENKMESLVNEKAQAIRHEVLQKIQAIQGQYLNSSTEAMITEVISLFRAQLQESAARGLEDSHMDARGELDFELIKDVVQQGQAELQVALRHELDNVVERIGDLRIQSGLSQDSRSFMEQLNTRTAKDFSGAIAHLSEHVESTVLTLRDTLVKEVLSTLTPILASVHSEPVDYEYLTAKLTQAVKPHISQLIDLASDKSETAGLIVDRILPLLPRSSPTTLDTDAISGHLVSEIRRLTAPIDPFEIKEQVADLVVERLDSRLALRDRSFNVETISGKINEGVAEPVRRMATTLETLAGSQQALSTRHDDMLSAHKVSMDSFSDLLTEIAAATKTIDDAARSRTEKALQADETLLCIRSAVEDLGSNQETLLHHREEVLTIHKDILNRLDAFPVTFAAATTILQESSAAITSSHETFKREADDLRKLNSEYQAQLAKARSAHGQVRVEKDVLSETLAEVESDRNNLRAQLKEMQITGTTQALEATALHARVFELEEALKQALERLKADDVTAQVNQERIVDLENTNRELAAERHTSKFKVCTLLSTGYCHGPC